MQQIYGHMFPKKVIGSDTHKNIKYNKLVCCNFLISCYLEGVALNRACGFPDLIY